MGLQSIDSRMFATQLQQQLVQRLQQLVSSLADQRRKEAVEPAAVELIRLMQRGALPEDLLQLLLHFVQAAGTPNSPALWTQVSERYPNVVSSFINLRFL